MKRLGLSSISILILVVVGIALPPAHAGLSQSAFFKAFTGSTGFEATSVQSTTDGGFIVAGFADAFGFQKQTLLLRLDSGGGLIWQKAYGNILTNSPVAFAGAPSVRALSNGGFVVATTTMISSIMAAWVFKIDNSGNIVWQEAFLGDGVASARSIDTASNGGYAVAAATFSPSVRTSLSRALVIRLDDLGSVMWQRGYNGTGIDAAPSTITHTDDGGFVLAGQTFPQSAWIARLDPFGNVLWQKLWQNSYQSEIVSVRETSDRGFIAAADMISISQSGSVTWGVFAIKLDRTGNTTWLKTYGVIQSTSSISDIQQISNGDYVLVGSAYAFRQGSFSTVIIRLDSMGTIRWQRTFSTSNQILTIPYSLVETENGKLVVVGTIRPFSLAPGSNQAWILRLDSNGEIGGCQLVGQASFAPTDTRIDTFTFPGTGTETDVPSEPIATFAVPESTSAVSNMLCR